MYDVVTIFHIQKLLIAAENLFWNVNDANTTTVYYYSFQVFTNILEKIPGTCNAV